MVRHSRALFVGRGVRCVGAVGVSIADWRAQPKLVEHGMEGGGEGEALIEPFLGFRGGPNLRSSINAPLQIRPAVTCIDRSSFRSAPDQGWSNQSRMCGRSRPGRSRISYICSERYPEKAKRKNCPCRRGPSSGGRGVVSFRAGQSSGRADRRTPCRMRPAPP